jgi:hypothetical protein
MIVEGKEGALFLHDNPIGKVESWKLSTSHDVEKVHDIQIDNSATVVGQFTGTLDVEDHKWVRRLRKQYRKLINKKGWFPIEMSQDADTFIKGLGRFSLWSRIKLRLGFLGKMHIKFKREANR